TNMGHGKWTAFIKRFSTHRVLNALYICMPQTSTHSHTDGGGFYLSCQPAHRERLGVQCLTQGGVVGGSVSCSRTLRHLVRRSWDQTSNLLIAERLLPPEPLSPRCLIPVILPV